MIPSSVDSFGFATCHVAMCYGENQKDGVSVNSRVVNTSNRIVHYITAPLIAYAKNHLKQA